MIDPGTAVAGLLTLAILSFLYRDNPFYKFAEYLLVGLSVGYVLVITWTNNVMTLLVQPLFVEGRLSLLIPTALGLMMFARFHTRTNSVSRIPLAVLVGSGAGVAIPAMIGPRVLKQLSETVTPFSSQSPEALISGSVVAIGLICTLAYFYFSREHRGILGVAANSGRYFLMVFFGATFGYTVMSRMSTFIGRMEFLLVDFFHLTK